MSLLTAITIERPPILPPVLPPVLQFGAGRLDLLGEAAVFGEVRPEPAKCKNQGSGRTNPARIQSHATQT